MSAAAARGTSYVLFEVAGATYAVPSADVLQLEMVGAVTPVPNAPAWVDGVASIRGQVLPVLNVRARFGFPRAPYDARSRLVVIRTEGRMLALAVDRAREFASIPPEAVQPPPADVAGLTGRYLRGLAHVGERLILVLEIAELLDDGEPGRADGAAAARD